MSIYPAPQNPICVGDFTKYEKAVWEGTLSHEKYNEIFVASRKHGLYYVEDTADGSAPTRPYVKGCAVGGSTVAKLQGISDYGGPAGIAAEYLALASKPLADREENDAQLTGHLFESAVRDHFSKVYNVKAMPCYLQYTNPNWPHSLANVDGLVIETDELGNEHLGIYEGKTLYNKKGAHADSFLLLDEVPEDYMMQIQFYMEVLNLDFTWICVAWGFTEGQMKAFRVARDREAGCSICQMAEEFANLVDDGTMPSNDGVANMRARLADVRLMYPHGDKSLPAVKFAKKRISVFQKADGIKEKLAEEQEKMLTDDDAIKTALEETVGSLDEAEKEEMTAKFTEALVKAREDMTKANDATDAKIKALEKELSETLTVLTEDLGDATSGTLVDPQTGDVYIFSFPYSDKFSKDAQSMNYLKKEYPEAYEALSKYKPAKRNFSYDKKPAGGVK